MSAKQRLVAAALALTITAAYPVAAHPASTLDAARPALSDCDTDDFARTLNATPEGSITIARAHWLNRQLIRWPGVPTSGHFRLHHSTRAQLLARVGTRVTGSDGALALDVFDGVVRQDLRTRFKFVGDGATLTVRIPDLPALKGLHARQLLLVQEDAAGTVLAATAIQSAGALDDLYASAADADDLGASVTASGTAFKLWAPTARAVSVCLHASGRGPAVALRPLRWDDASGIWSGQWPTDDTGRYYTYLVDVFVPGIGIVRNRVTDPYSVSLTADSRRSYIADLDAPQLKPAGWDEAKMPSKVAAQTDMVIYELHVRDFSISDSSVSTTHRGKYLAFTEPGSNGMRHLRALADAGLTDIHLLPVFDFATVPETGCVTPDTHGAADSELQQAAVVADARNDCFNWGYDPYHFSAPEGGYASDAADGATRIREFRRMVMALHAAGLRVGMDVVYNHTTTSGQKASSVLDRIVPGYYHRLDANGVVERSTCCDNTATEHRMMGKLMADSVVLWATQYRIDSFRFDLMGHQPRAEMEALGRRVDSATGRHIHLIGEGWNFGRSRRWCTLRAGLAAVLEWVRDRHVHRPRA